MPLRIFMMVIGLFLAFSGLTALMDPRPLMVGHASLGRFSRARPLVVAEMLSKEGMIGYAYLSLVLGLAAMWAAKSDVLGTTGRDRKIAAAIARVAPELLSRYGREDDCTQEQIEAVAGSLSVDEHFYPYLYAAFLGRGALQLMEQDSQGIGWPEVEETVGRICFDLARSGLGHGHFHESWREPQST